MLHNTALCRFPVCLPRCLRIKEVCVEQWVMWQAEHGQFGEFGHFFSSVYVRNGSNRSTNLPGSAASLGGNSVASLRFTAPHDDIFACCSSTKTFFRFSFAFKRLSVIFLSAGGHSLFEISRPWLKRALPCSWTVTSCHASQSLSASVRKPDVRRYKRNKALPTH